MGQPIAITRTGLTASELRVHAVRTDDGAVVRCLLTIALPLEGHSRIAGQDHRAIRRQTGPMPGFKFSWPAAVTPAGVELMHMIRKGQLALTGEPCPARQSCSLAEQTNLASRAAPGYYANS